MNTIFTIGHSINPIEYFIAILKTYQITALVDVRSNPNSQHVPQFNEESLKKRLNDMDIKYVFMGGELGARRTEESSYIDGRARYDLIKELPSFRKGLDRVLHGMGEYRVVLMCTESDPLDCHRTILVCRELLYLNPKLRIKHILKDGSVESQADVEKRLIALHKIQPELFDGIASKERLINRAYDTQSKRISYKKDSARETK